jgi:hypothetical protein
MQKLFLSAIVCSLFLVGTLAMGGQWKESDNLSLDDPLNQKLIGVSMETLQKQDLSFQTVQWRVLEIISIQTQIVAGTNYKMKVKLGGTDGSVKYMMWKIFYQSWTDTIELKQAIEDTPTKEKTPVMGGWKDQPVNMDDPTLKKVLEAAMTELTASNGLLSEGGWTLTNVATMRTQVTAGINYQLVVELTNSAGAKKYMMWLVNAQPWNNTYTLKSYTETSANRQLQMGAYREQDLSKIKGGAIQYAVQTALLALTEDHGLLGDGPWICDEIISVETQVVNGINYKITAKFTNTDTKADQTIEFVVYQAPGQAPHMTSASLVSQTGGNRRLLSSKSTDGIMLNNEKIIIRKPEVLGGWTTQPVNMNNPGLNTALDTAMGSLTANGGELSTGEWSVQKVNRVQTQVVAGTNYRINVTVVNAKGQTKQMQWVVFVQPWTNTASLTSSKDIQAL